MTFWDGITVVLVVVGACFFLAGSLGMLRFPDTLTRLHAATKADNVGLGFVILGLLLQTDSFFEGVKLVIIWLLVALSGAAACYLIARVTLQDSQRSRSGA
ncbi:MAG: monovalent cation/H(+) antiporter subunit G [Planctomycetaceae bacterium]|nr:MAG: monovalent cation/H(+) antiporter subunit G [Planctomycetaceae bacterium]